MRTDREKAIESLAERTVKGAQRASEALRLVTGDLKLLIPFMHNAIINETGDMKEANRADLSKKLDPELIAVMGYVTVMQELAVLYNDDAAIYAQNVADYITTHPEALTEVETLMG